MHRFHALTLATLVALAACSSGGSGRSGGSDRGVPTLSVYPGAWTVQAGGAPKQFVSVLSGSTDPVSWSIETAGDAAHVGSLDGSGLYTPPAVLAVARDVVVKATAGALVARATVHVTALPGPFTVSGTVVDDVGKPYPGAKVFLGVAAVTAAADGSFTIPDVAPPYDVTIAVESDSKVAKFVGVTDLTPVLWIWRGFPSARFATVKGVVTHDGVPTIAEVYGPWASTYAVNASGYTLSDTWFGDPSVTLIHRASWVGFDTTTGMPAAYWHGSRVVALTENATITGQDIAMTALPTGRVSGTILAGGDGLDLTSLGFTGTPHFDDGTAKTLFAYTMPDVPLGPFALAVPVLPDGTFRLGLGASGVAGGTTRASAPVVPGQDGVTLSLPAIPAPVSPADGATGHGAFSWTTAETGGTDAVSFSCGATPILIYVYGAGRSVTIPSVPGITIPAGTSCDWTPRWLSYSMDELVKGPLAVDALPVQRHGYGPSRSFTY